MARPSFRDARKREPELEFPFAGCLQDKNINALLSEFQGTRLERRRLKDVIHPLGLLMHGSSMSERCKLRQGNAK